MVKVARGEETSQKVIAKGFVNGHDSLGQDRGMGRTTAEGNFLQRRTVVYFIFADCRSGEKRRRMRGKDEGVLQEERKENKRGKGSFALLNCAGFGMKWICLS